MSLYYEEYGNVDGTLMLFIHGGGVGGWMWDKQVQYFTDYHCVVPYLLRTDLNEDVNEFSIKSSAEQLIELIDQKAKGKKVIVIGFSLGAQIAIQMVSMRPQLIDLTIINSALVRPIPFAKYLIHSSIKLTYPLIKNKAFSKLQARTLYIGKDDFENYYQESSTIKRNLLIKILTENMAFEIPKNFQAGQAKLLVTVGETEKTIVKKSAIEIENSNPNCMRIMFSEISHGAPLAEPDLFNQVIEKWIVESIR